jgi:hypothetical protein
VTNPSLPQPAPGTGRETRDVFGLTVITDERVPSGEVWIGYPRRKVVYDLYGYPSAYVLGDLEVVAKIINLGATNG